MRRVSRELHDAVNDANVALGDGELARLLAERERARRVEAAAAAVVGAWLAVEAIGDRVEPCLEQLDDAIEVLADTLSADLTVSPAGEAALAEKGGSDG